MRCRCGQCRSCQENQRFEAVFERLHGHEERAYYAERPRGAGLRSSLKLDDATLYPSGRPRRGRVKRSLE